MKKVFLVLICFFFLIPTTAFAEIHKSISNNSITLNLRTNPLDIIGTKKVFAAEIIRSGYFDSFLGITKTDTNHTFWLMIWEQYPTTKAISDFSFSLKTPPRFIANSNGIEKTISFKVESISNEFISYTVDNSSLRPLINADKVSIILTLKDGSTQTIDIPDDVLKDWRYIVSCDLLKEYKKGI